LFIDMLAVSGDWLGLGTEKTETKANPSDWLGLGPAKESTPQPKEGDDWLGLGEEKEVTKPKVETPHVKAAVQPETR
jgi:hypothetical protein